MDAHANLKNLLGGAPGRKFVEALTAAAVPGAVIPKSDDLKYRVMTEFTVRYDTKRGKKKNFRMDAYWYIVPGILAMRDRTVYTVAMEIKGQLNDLIYDNKALAYLGWSDFFFWGVPGDLVEEACAKVLAADNRAMGVVNIETGDIVIMPLRMKISWARSEARWVAVASYLLTSQDVVLYPGREQVMGLDEREFEEEDIENEEVGENEGIDEEEEESPELMPVDRLQSPANEPVPVPEGVSDEERKARAERKEERIEAAAAVMELATPHQAWALNRLEPAAQAVWACIVRHEGENQDKAVCSSTIRKELNLTLAQISKYIYMLSRSGLVEKVGDAKPSWYRRRNPDLNIKDDGCLDCDFFASAYGCTDPSKCGDCNKDCDEKKVTTAKKGSDEKKVTIKPDSPSLFSEDEIASEN